MPQLPSGMQVALDPAPLNRLLAGLAQGDEREVEALNKIRTPLDCLKYFELLCWSAGELKEAARLMGLRPADIFTAHCDWSAADKQFFYKYLTGPRLATYLAAHFLRVQKRQRELL